ncbi:unnamed protein product, partial [Symbiodinium necroappetens]
WAAATLCTAKARVQRFGCLRPLDLLRLGRASRCQHAQLKDLVSLLCIPTALGHRLGKAARALRQELARAGWSEPRKEKFVREMAASFEQRAREFQRQSDINSALVRGGAAPAYTLSASSGDE